MARRTGRLTGRATGFKRGMVGMAEAASSDASRSAPVIGTLPMIAVAVGVYVIGIGYTFYWSFTTSKLFPNNHLVGLSQYQRLWGDDALGNRRPEHLDLRRTADRLLPGVRLPARGLHGPAHPPGRPLPLDLPLSLRHVADRHRPHLAVDAGPQSRHREHHSQFRLDELPFLAAGRPQYRDLRPGGRRHVAGLRRDHGDPARRPARRRRRKSGRRPRSTAFPPGASTCSSRCR